MSLFSLLHVSTEIETLNAITNLRATIEAALSTFNAKELQLMTTLAEIKTSLDALKSSEEKLVAFAVATQASLASVQSQLAAAAANTADPAALQAIADEITTMQTEVADVVSASPASPPPSTSNAPASGVTITTQSTGAPLPDTAASGGTVTTQTTTAPLPDAPTGGATVTTWAPAAS